MNTPYVKKFDPNTGKLLNPIIIFRPRRVKRASNSILKDLGVVLNSMEAFYPNNSARHKGVGQTKPTIQVVINFLVEILTITKI